MGERYLEGRAAWVTGGASGMGRATALALAEAGADVAVGSLAETDRRPIDPGQTAHFVADREFERVRADIEAHGVRALAFPLDVRSADSVTNSHDAVVGAFGKIDILVNAAGTSTKHYIAGHPEALWLQIIDVNLSGPYRTIKLCLPGMIERNWGRIINIASTAANVGAVAQGAYCASKSGLLGLTRCVALEGAPHGVSCNAINPGSVATPQNTIAVKQLLKIHGEDMSVEDHRRRIAAQIPQRRLVEATEIAALAAFLCRDEAFGITMQDLTVSAGSHFF